MRSVRFLIFLFFLFPLSLRAEGVDAQSQNSTVKIFVDPGHGGEDKGAVGVEGVLEKAVTLNIAKYLDALLKERLGVTVILSRTEDKEISLAERGRLANESQADMLVSIHANASRPKTYHGIETYYLDNTDDKASLKLADRENASMGEGNTDISFMFSDIIQSAKLEDSISLAHRINSGIIDHLRGKYQKIRDLGVKKAPFYVLVGAHMPCVLTEVSFIDHPTEGKNLISERYQRDVAEGIFNGIKRYLVEKKKINEAGNLKPPR
jgi:N-acetylmuramoyl-L-alanine amidase